MGFRHNNRHKKETQLKHCHLGKGHHVINRPKYNKTKFKLWSLDDLGWLCNHRLKTVFFLDQCMEISKRIIAEQLSSDIKIIPFPHGLTSAYDETVLRTVMDFLKNHHELLRRKVDCYIFTRDEQFIIDSNAEQIFEEYGFKIKFLTLYWSRLCIREIKSELSLI